MGGILNQNWRQLHYKVICDFLLYLNNNSDKYVLKGGTALMLCYNLSRFSEDIDLDSTDSDTIFSILDRFCNSNGFTYRIAKNTDITKRFFIHYSPESKPLKVEISYRNSCIDYEDTTKINNILVYNIDNLALLKSSAYSGRDKIRDLYDIVFIILNYYNVLSKSTIKAIKANIQHKGIEQCDYIIQTQKDSFIDSSALEESFLVAWYMLGLK